MGIGIGRGQLGISIAGGRAPSAAVDIPTPTAYWKLNEASGAATDQAAAGNHGTAVNSPGTAVGKVGDARTFVTASSQYFSVADSAQLTYANVSLTMAFWVKFSSTAGTQFMVARDATGNRAFGAFNAVTLQTTFFWSGGFAILDSGVTPIAGTWYHILAYHNASNDTVGLSVNNAAAVTAATNGNQIVSPAVPITFGRRDFGGSENYFSGSLDEIAWFNGTLLDATQKSNLYNAGAGRTWTSAGGWE